MARLTDDAFVAKFLQHRGTHGTIDWTELARDCGDLSTTARQYALRYNLNKDNTTQLTDEELIAKVTMHTAGGRRTRWQKLAADCGNPYMSGKDYSHRLDRIRLAEFESNSDPWSQAEVQCMLREHARQLGLTGRPNGWTQISKGCPGRTPHACKNAFVLYHKNKAAASRVAAPGCVPIRNIHMAAAVTAITATHAMVRKPEGARVRGMGGAQASIWAQSLLQGAYAPPTAAPFTHSSTGVFQACT